MRAILQSPIIR